MTSSHYRHLPSGFSELCSFFIALILVCDSGPCLFCSPCLQSLAENQTYGKLLVNICWLCRESGLFYFIISCYFVVSVSFAVYLLPSQGFDPTILGLTTEIGNCRREHQSCLLNGASAREPLPLTQARSNLNRWPSLPSPLSGAPWLSRSGSADAAVILPSPHPPLDFFLLSPPSVGLLKTLYTFPAEPAYPLTFTSLLTLTTASRVLTLQIAPTLIFLKQCFVYVSCSLS